VTLNWAVGCGCGFVFPKLLVVFPARCWPGIEKGAHTSYAAALGAAFNLLNFALSHSSWQRLLLKAKGYSRVTGAWQSAMEAENPH